MIPALVIGREGSRGFTGKNVLPVLGRPLMAYPIMAAQASKYIDSVWISTDSEKIKEIGYDMGCGIIDRPDELCTAEALGEDAFRHGYDWLRDNHNEEIEMVVLLFANAPTVTGAIIDEGVEALREDEKRDSATTVSAYNMWSPLRARKLGDDGFLHPFVPFETFGDPKSLSCDRDSQGNVFFADMGASIVRPRCLENMEDGLLPQKWMGRNIHPLKQWGGCDIDYEWQVPMAEFWLRKHDFQEEI